MTAWSRNNFFNAAEMRNNFTVFGYFLTSALCSMSTNNAPSKYNTPYVFKVYKGEFSDGT